MRSVPLLVKNCPGNNVSLATSSSNNEHLSTTNRTGNRRYCAAFHLDDVEIVDGSRERDG